MPSKSTILAAVRDHGLPKELFANKNQTRNEFFADKKKDS
jgi:hypothetical protein